MALLLTAGSPSMSGTISGQSTTSPLMAKGISSASLERVSSVVSLRWDPSSSLVPAVITGAVISENSGGCSTWT